MADPRVANEARYDRMAPSYERALRVASFGTIRRLYRAVASALEVREGGSVVEVGCGPATVTPYLRAALGDSIAITGIDLSGEMIALARDRAERNGWKNVEYLKADAATWQPRGPVDVVVFCLVLSCLPAPLVCADRALSWLQPGGQLIVLDSFLRPGHPIANWAVRTKAPHVGAVPDDLPLDDLVARLDAPRTQPHLLGSYILVSGRKR
jgi:ubiquinone/menaquinone biosynthesis C-methylase UbiE